MREGLGWRACAVEKVDFVDVLLDVTLQADDEEEAPSSHSLSSGDSGAGGEDPTAAAGDPDASPRARVRALAHLQIQLSDFEAAFAHPHRSEVALAAVQNVVDLRGSRWRRRTAKTSSAACAASWRGCTRGRRRGGRGDGSWPGRSSSCERWSTRLRGPRHPQRPACRPPRTPKTKRATRPSPSTPILT